MRSKSSIGNYIDLLRKTLNDLEEILDDEIDPAASLQWKDRAMGLLKGMLGKNHAYVKEFDSIGFTTAFYDDLEDMVEEDTFRIALEDARSFLASLLDELESEHNCSPGFMDMESMFAEMNRYVVTHVGDPLTRSTLHTRITRLRNGIMTGEISSDEVRHHMEHIGYLDEGLYERIVPLITWYYMQGAGFRDVYNT